MKFNKTFCTLYMIALPTFVQGINDTVCPKAELGYTVQNFILSDQFSTISKTQDSIDSKPLGEKGGYVFFLVNYDFRSGSYIASSFKDGFKSIVDKPYTYLYKVEEHEIDGEKYSVPYNIYSLYDKIKDIYSIKGYVSCTYRITAKDNTILDLELSGFKKVTN